MKAYDYVGDMTRHANPGGCDNVGGLLEHNILKMPFFSMVYRTSFLDRAEPSRQNTDLLWQDVLYRANVHMASETALL